MGYCCTEHILSPLEKNISEKSFFNYTSVRTKRAKLAYPFLSVYVLKSICASRT